MTILRQKVLLWCPRNDIAALAMHIVALLLRILPFPTFELSTDCTRCDFGPLLFLFIL
jgi:hypothetical protein